MERRPKNTIDSHLDEIYNNLPIPFFIVNTHSEKKLKYVNNSLMDFPNLF